VLRYAGLIVAFPYGVLSDRYAKFTFPISPFPFRHFFLMVQVNRQSKSDEMNQMRSTNSMHVPELGASLCSSFA
jgi:hypothetical protein